jgi:hypothetical protein
MSLTTRLQKGIYTALDSPVIEILADNVGAEKVLPIFRKHFTFFRCYQIDSGIVSVLGSPDAIPSVQG